MGLGALAGMSSKAPKAVAMPKPLPIPQATAAKPAKIPKPAKVPQIKVAKVADRFPSEIKQEQRRITGVTPKTVKGYQESPARWLPKHSLRSAARVMGAPKT
jgi:hypothetical protein